MNRVSAALLLMLFSMGFAGVCAAETKIGVVVMHGRWDSPSGNIVGFANRLEKAGFLVETPEMPWSGRRLYDADFATFVKETNAAVKSLRDKGAQKICVAGHSSGGVGAVYYATQAKVDCVIGMVTAPYPTSSNYQAKIKGGLEKARSMAAEGKLEEKAWFEDYNTGNRTKNVQTTARIFLETNDVGGPGDTMRNVGLLQPGTQVLWVTSTGEVAVARQNQQAAYEAIPATVPKKFLEVSGDHLVMPDNTVDPTIEWLNQAFK